MAAIRTNRFGILCIDFRYRNRRYVLSTEIKDTKPNRVIVSRKAKAIEYDISLNMLDICKYFPHYKSDKSVTGDTVTDFFDHYIKEKTLKPSSWRNLHWIWRDHISPYFGHLILNDITRHDVLVFKNALIDKGLANTTVNVILEQLASLFTRAHDEGRIKLYPMRKIGKLDSTSEKIDPFSFDELRHFLTYLKDNSSQYYDMIFIWSRCGFRFGEILGLKWDDLDYYNSTISVNRTILNDGSEGTPKTSSSRRSITLRPEVIDAFKRQESRSRMSSEYIFTSHVTGTRFRASKNFYLIFRRLLILARLKVRSPNQLRHTFATLHIAAGESISWVSKMLGHRDVQTTLRRYNKYIPNLTHDDGSAFEKAFQKHQNGDTLVTPTANIAE